MIYLFFMPTSIVGHYDTSSNAVVSIPTYDDILQDLAPSSSVSKKSKLHAMSSSQGSHHALFV